MDLSFSGKRETDGQWGDDFLDLEGTMILVIQLLRGVARFDVAPIEHHQVSYLVCRGFLSRRIGVPAHSLLFIFQPFPGLFVHGLHPGSGRRFGCPGWVVPSTPGPWLLGGSHS